MYVRRNESWQLLFKPHLKVVSDKKSTGTTESQRGGYRHSTCWKLSSLVSSSLCKCVSFANVDFFSVRLRTGTMRGNKVSYASLSAWFLTTLSGSFMRSTRAYLTVSKQRNMFVSMWWSSVFSISTVVLFQASPAAQRQMSWEWSAKPQQLCGAVAPCVMSLFNEEISTELLG